MSNKTLNFIAGLPRSGGSLIASVLSQNPKLHGDANSGLPNILSLLHQAWQGVTEIPNQTRGDIMRSVIDGYYANQSAGTVFAKSPLWIPLIPLLESVLQQKIKILVCVRNPAEILTSLERTRLANPLSMSMADTNLRDQSNITSRCYYYSNPQGTMGSAHTHIQDAVIMGYLDRMLFVDYGLYCGSPRSQTQRIYDFFELDDFEHDFNNIPQLVPGVKSRIDKVSVNCVQYLGLNLFEQYNSEIFWNAWI